MFGLSANGRALVTRRRQRDAADYGDAVEVVDARTIAGRGPAWGTATPDLNATVLVWRSGEGQPPHVNNERDVVLVVVEGSGTVTIERRAASGRGGDARRHSARGESLDRGRCGWAALCHGAQAPRRSCHQSGPDRPREATCETSGPER